MVVRRFFCDTVENQGQIRVFRLVGLLSHPGICARDPSPDISFLIYFPMKFSGDLQKSSRNIYCCCFFSASGLFFGFVGFLSGFFLKIYFPRCKVLSCPSLPPRTSNDFVRNSPNSKDVFVSRFSVCTLHAMLAEQLFPP